MTSHTRPLLIVGSVLLTVMYFVLAGDAQSPSPPPPSNGGDEPAPSPARGENNNDGSGQRHGKQQQPPPSTAAHDAQTLAWQADVYNYTSPPGHALPAFFVRPATRRDDLRIRWQCKHRPIGPFHADSPTTPWPTCRMLDHDMDGKTFQYLVERVMCGLPQFAPILLKSGDINSIRRSAAAGADTADVPSHRPLRVLQVGANSGGNQNDPLVKLLKGAFAQAVLLEPVPWIFHKLHETYASLGGLITCYAGVTRPRGPSSDSGGPSTSPRR